MTNYSEVNKQGFMFDDSKIRQADASYKSFPSFNEWATCFVNNERWEKYSTILKRKDEISAEMLGRAQEIVKRAAAIDTGAIEGLYEVDRGFTFTVATQAAMWESLLESKGQNVKALFQSQLEAYDYVLDFATKRTPIAEAWIRTLHSEICKPQATYPVYTTVGIQEQPLPKGKYKVNPNHVMRSDGKIHSYSPVDLTPAEMHRFCNELNSEAFQSAHPILQASFAHYAFVVIHPFADGNGRVARALASAFTYRAYSIPVLVLMDEREAYYDTLEAADNGDYQKFIDFVLERGIDSIKMMEESFSAAKAPDANGAISTIKSLYVTKGGYSHEEVDKIGSLFFQSFLKELKELAIKYQVPQQIRIDVQTTSNGYEDRKSMYRIPISSKVNGISLTFHASPPATLSYSVSFLLLVPKDCDKEDEFVIRWVSSNTDFKARLTEIVPQIKSSLTIRIKIFLEKVFGDVLTKIAIQAKQKVKGSVI
ncbi:MAG: Fic family protein [Ignavibacteriae bacterium]|nr:Fic family protein [Ignavibacteriota bacterium]